MGCSRTIVWMLALWVSPYVVAQTEKSDPLRFDPAKFSERQMESPVSDGEMLKYRAYEGIYYVGNVVDSVYQTLNIYVPEPAYQNSANTPVFLKTNVGGYRAARASAPSATDATGRALQEGYVVVIPGSRGTNSAVRQADGSTLYTGTAPAGIVDLKAAVRYLRHNAGRIPGNTERIITDGTSAGGAMSSLLGATGNHPGYDPYLKELGAADQRDDVFAAVCYCPITDLEHADMAYEWLFQRVNDEFRFLVADQLVVSQELAALYPGYLSSLGLRMEDGTPLTEDNYADYLKSFLIQSAQRALEESLNIPEETGVKLNTDFLPGAQALAKRAEEEGIDTLEEANKELGTDPHLEDRRVLDIDFNAYLGYVIRQREPKTPPAFDAMNVIGNRATPENNVFGDPGGTPANFTEYSLRKASGSGDATLSPALEKRIVLLNPMHFIGDGVSRTAPYWYIRHGAVDRDTSFPVPVNLYTKLLNNGYKADFRLPWNRDHSGDYDLDELFAWIARVVRNREE